MSLLVVGVETPRELDAFEKSGAFCRSVGINVATVFTPLRAYEDFAATNTEGNTNISVAKCAPRTGLHYFLTFTVEYEGKGVGRIVFM